MYIIVIIVTIIITIIIYTYINYYIYICVCVLMWDLNQQQWEYDGNKPSKWLLTGDLMMI